MSNIEKHTYTIEVETDNTDYEGKDTKIRIKGTAGECNKFDIEYTGWPAEVCYSMFRSVILGNDYSDYKNEGVNDENSEK